MFITNVDILKCFVLKRAVPTKLVQPHFCQRFVSKRQNLNRNLLDPFEQPGVEHDGIFTQGTRQEKPESGLLSQLHFKLPTKLKLVNMTSRLAAWPLSTGFKMVAHNAKFWPSLETNFPG